MLIVVKPLLTCYGDLNHVTSLNMQVFKMHQFSHANNSSSEILEKLDSNSQTAHAQYAVHFRSGFCTVVVGKG